MGHVVLRMHFTAEDLARTRVADTPRPLLEAGMVAWLLAQSPGTRPMEPWQRKLYQRLLPRVRHLIGEVPQMNGGPGFLVSPTDAGTPREAIERVLATPVPWVREQVATLAGENEALVEWARRIDSGGQGLLRQTLGVLEWVHEEVITPQWARIDTLASADRAVRVQSLAAGGVGALLACLDPLRVRWRPPVLEVAHPGEVDVGLGGRGLLLIPSPFSGQPLAGADLPFDTGGDEPQRWLAFPAHSAGTSIVSTRPAAPPPRTVPRRLTALLGRTRATVLCTIAEHPGSTTTQLAARAGIAPASASEHATVLRQAGLTASARHRNMVLHTPTAAGISLLNAVADGAA
ncbi:ArsR/SmtB family transcription factor [Streptomyces gamaensis]|uniref:ArsR/SmtB family transcription factor n=1 Tax=Streptomyces gamaensis TaxID=1763542 RepID=A0ABW0Z170_9ACTN